MLKITIRQKLPIMEIKKALFASISQKVIVLNKWIAKLGHIQPKAWYTGMHATFVMAHIQLENAHRNQKTHKHTSFWEWPSK